jgi:hypothetical protein
MGETVLALGYVVVYALGALGWYADDAPLSIVVIPLSPFVFPWYAAWLMLLGAMDPSPQRQQRRPRNRRADRNEHRDERRRQRQQQRQILEEGSSSPGLLERIKQRLRSSTGDDAELDLDTTFAEMTDAEQGLDLDTSFADYTDPLDLDTSFADTDRDDRR